MDTKLLKKLLRKTHLITYVWYNLRTNIRSSQYLNDAEDRHSEFEYIMQGRYSLYAGVYLYHQSRAQLKLIAIISNTGIKQL